MAARESIAEAVRRVDTARGKLRRLDPDRALEIWTAMVDGEWTLVDQVERDGKRFVLVHRNRLESPESLSAASTAKS